MGPPVPSSSAAAAAGAGSCAPLRDKRTSNASTVELMEADFDGSPLRPDSELESTSLLGAGLFVKPGLRQRTVLAKAGIGPDPAAIAAFKKS